MLMRENIYIVKFPWNKAKLVMIKVPLSSSQCFTVISLEQVKIKRISQTSQLIFNAISYIANLSRKQPINSTGQ